MTKVLLFTAALCFALSTGARLAMADEKMEEKKSEEKMEEKKDAAKGEKTDEKAASHDAAGGGVTCKNGGDTRTLEKKDMEGGGCEVIYTKGGEGKSVAQAKNDLSYCDKTIEKMKANLTGSGFTCE